jgi:ribosomal-protein-alanine N-acetyltransferase
MNIFRPQTTIRDARPEDRQQLANLIHFEIHVHRHLDWRTPLEWIGSPPYVVLEQHKSLLAALACPPDPRQVAWIRLFAAAHALSVERAWDLLWAETLEQFKALEEVRWAAALALWPWFVDLLEKRGFVEENRVVMLNWDNVEITPLRFSPELVIRPMNLDDIPLVEAVDATAFSQIWQNSQRGLSLAYRQAAVATVAELAGQMVGYQISTATPVGGHLARLAVLPGYQGQGIGLALVQDMLLQFRRRSAQRITVNTQKDNPASLQLYQKVGFYRTGEEYPLFVYRLR